MTAKIPSPVVGILLIVGGLVFALLGGLHAAYTLMDLHVPRRLVPADPSVAQAMANSPLRLSRGKTDMWHTWIGLNFTHSLGLLLFAAVAIWAGARINMLSANTILALTVVGCIYLAIALRYFFRGPAIGLAVGTGCFATAWVLLLWQRG
jgi:hypothetical protein